MIIEELSSVFEISSRGESFFSCGNGNKDGSGYGYYLGDEKGLGSGAGLVNGYYNGCGTDSGTGCGIGDR